MTSDQSFLDEYATTIHDDEDESDRTSEHEDDADPLTRIGEIAPPEPRDG